MKQFYLNLKWIPEFYFIMVSILWFYLSVNMKHANGVNFPAILLIVLFHMQLFLNDQKFGKFLAIVVVLGSLALLYILSLNVSGLMHFDQNSQMFTLGMGNLIIVNLIMALLMYRKHKIFNTPLGQG